MEFITVELHPFLPRTPIASKDTEIWALWPFGLQTRDSFSAPSDDDLLSSLYGIKECAKVAFGFGYADGLHGWHLLVI